MEITWYGLNCFRLSERSYPTVVTDPFDEEESGLALPRTRAEIVTSSSLADPDQTRWKGLRGPYRVLSTPGEYEIGGVFVTSIATFRDRKKGLERGQNLIHVIECKGVTVCHLGALGHIPSQSQVEAIGSVHVLLLPVGAPGGLNPSMASEIVSMIEPNIVVPMDYQISGLKFERESVERFLKEMGITKSVQQDSLKVSASTNAEETSVVILEPQRNGNG